MSYICIYNKISKAAEITEAYSADMVRLSNVKKEAPNGKEQHKVPKVESTEEEQADQFEKVDHLLPTWTTNFASLSKGSLFLVLRSSRFGRSIKINSRILS